MTRLSRRTAVLAALTSTVAFAGPALAGSTATSSLPVSLQTLGGTRQFAVEDLGGNPLTALDLGTTGTKPFRTHVTDSGFTDLTHDYAVTSKMTNLYLKTGDTHNYGTKIDSSDVSITFGGTPLSLSGLLLPVLPKLTITAIPTCAALPTSVTDTTGSLLTALPTSPLGQACSALTAASAATSGATVIVDGVLQTVTPLLTSVLDAPVALGGASGGAFTLPDFTGVGASDPGKTSTPGTSVSLMTGVPGLTTNLANAIKNALADALAGLPLTAASGTAAKTTVDAVLQALNNSSTAAFSTLGGALGALTGAQQLAIVNTLTASLNLPTLASITSVSGQYFAFPTLTAKTSAPVAGTYDGTMTVTFIQK
jgi:hypothetical protein